MSIQGVIGRGAARELIIDHDSVGQRIDNYLIKKLKNVPRSRIYRILRKGEVRVNKGRIRPTYRLNMGDVVRIPPLDKVTVPVSQGKPSRQLVQLVERSILHEDKQLIVINKPSGIAVHGGSGVSFGIIEVMRHMFPEAPYLELVHRLDRDTSGCLIIAKRRSVLRQLHELLRSEGGVDKRYLALVKGAWKDTVRSVRAPLKKNVLCSGERVVRVDDTGKASHTEFMRRTRFKHATLVEAWPRTGRTHQIRVHADYLGHPIGGDEKYGCETFNALLREKGLKRLFLHAASVEFQLPESKKSLFVAAPLGDVLDRCLARLD